jgi:ATP-binding cassette subfamily D (ALD) long-chain fatty acid import protein
MILIKKVIPGWSSIEARYIVILSVLLVVRTMLSIWLADVNGKVVKAIVEMSWTNFVQRVSDLFFAT